MKANAMDVDTALLPRDPLTGEALAPREQPGYYPGYSTTSQKKYWDEATRKLVQKRVQEPPTRKFFTEEQWAFWTSVFSHLVPQHDRTPDRQIPLVPVLDERLAAKRTLGYRYEDMPEDWDAYSLGMEAIEAEAKHRYGGSFTVLSFRQGDAVLKAIQEEKPEAANEIWKKMSVARFWQMIMSDAIDAYYAHPWAWDEIGFGGPAYPRAYTRLERGEPEPWEVEERRYEWEPPAVAASSEVGVPDDQDQSHHGSGGTH